MAEKIQLVRLIKAHPRGKRDPIPAGTVGTVRSKNEVVQITDHKAVHFPGFGTYYILESKLLFGPFSDDGGK